MKYVIVPACLGLLLLAAPAPAQVHREREREQARRAHEEHWRTHPERPEDLVRFWHQRLFHREIAPALRDRWVVELRRGIAAPVALAHILAGPEYYVQVGSRPEAWVRNTFVQIVGREPTQAEFQFWLDRLYHEDRDQVAYEMVTRYPPAWINQAPVVVAPAPVVTTRVVPAPVIVPAPVEVYEYRRPIIRYHR